MRGTDRLKLKAGESTLALLRADPDLTLAGREATGKLQAIHDEVGQWMDRRFQAQQAGGMAVSDRNRCEAALRQGLMELRAFGMAAARRAADSGLRFSCRPPERWPGALAPAAEAMLAEVPGRIATLLSYGMPAELVERVRQELAGFEEANERRRRAVAVCAEAGAAFRRLAAESFAVVRHLDVLARRRLKHTPTLLAEWRRVQAIEWPAGRDRRRAWAGTVAGTTAGAGATGGAVGTAAMSGEGEE